MRADNDVLDLPLGVTPDPGEFIRAAMEWHFNPKTGSPFWLAQSLDFDPRTDINSHDDLRLFPNVAADLRNVPAADLIPRGYGSRPCVAGIFESGGTTGAPKRVIVTQDWMDRMVSFMDANFRAHGFVQTANWLGIVPTGPHLVGELFRRCATRHGAHAFPIDLDPRWVKKLIAEGRGEDAAAYAEHLIDQAAFVLRSQDIGAVMITPPLLERLAARDDLVELVNETVHAISWGGTQLDPDSRQLYKAEVFPGVTIRGNYGGTMMLGVAAERPLLADDGHCVFDPLSPYVTFSVVDPANGQPVGYGERGQVVVNHVSRCFLLPNNLERDMAIRIPPADGQVGDSVANLTPVETFESEAVIEGVY